MSTLVHLGFLVISLYVLLLILSGVAGIVYAVSLMVIGSLKDLIKR